MSRLRADSGDTLVEILVALAVLGIGIVALTGALLTSVTTTTVNRQQAQAESVLVSAAEHVKALPLPATCAGSGTATVGTADVPRDPAYTVTYGPAHPVEGQPCAQLLAVPVRVTGHGFDLAVTVVRRP